MLKIACVGIAVQDRLYYVDRLPTVGGKYVAENYREVGGGPAATAAVAAARLGAEVDFIGRVGDDECGNSLLNELNGYQVNTAFSRQIVGARSSQSAILVDRQGERMIINHPSPDLPDEASWLQTIDFSGYDMVLADVRWHQGALQAFTLARAAQVPTLLDADTTPQDIQSLIALADHTVFSRPGLARVAAHDEVISGLHYASTLTAGAVYVTCGQEGCFWRENDNIAHHPALVVNVVDTTGAGDVFHGALAVALAQQLPTRNAVQMATACAALKCTHPGGRAGIPDQRQVASLLSST